MEPGWRRLRSCFARTTPGGPGVTVRPYYEGLPFEGLDAGRMKAGESLPDRGGAQPPVRPRKHGPEAQNRRGGAPKGVRACD